MALLIDEGPAHALDQGPQEKYPKNSRNCRQEQHARVALHSPLRASSATCSYCALSAVTSRFCSATSRSGSWLASAGAISFFTTAYETSDMSAKAARARGARGCRASCAEASCSSSSVSTHITRITNESARNSGAVQAG